MGWGAFCPKFTSYPWVPFGNKAYGPFIGPLPYQYWGGLIVNIKLGMYFILWQKDLLKSVFLNKFMGVGGVLPKNAFIIFVQFLLK
jgi:hypothetical protein